MKKTVLLAAAALLALSPLSAQAEDTAAAHSESNLEAGQQMVAPEPQAMVPDVAPARAVLEDGTELVIEGDAVFAVGADGTQTPAPDGTHTLSDGSTITTSGGMMVHEDGHDHDAGVEAEADVEVEADVDAGL